MGADLVARRNKSLTEMQRSSVNINAFLGLNDQPNVFLLKPGECSVFDNFMTNGYTAEKRPGYVRRIATAYAGAPKVTGLGQMVDSANVAHFLAVMSGKLLEDVNGTWTERAAGRTIDSTALCQVAGTGSLPSGGAHTGSVVINDQTNPPLIWSGSGVADIFIPDITRASCCAAYREFFFLGDYTSTKEGRSICTVAVTDPSNPQAILSKSPTNRQSQVVSIVPTAHYVLIFLKDALWWATYAPSSGGFAGGTAFNFNFDVLRPGIGIVGPMAAVNVPGSMTVFWGRGRNKNGGPFIVPEADPQAGPIYIGKPIENLISGLDSNYLSGIVANWLPNCNGILFQTPYGSSQSTNNMCMFYHTIDKTWACWKNDNTDIAFSFASGAAVIDSDGSSQLYCGTYNGKVMKMGTGLQDDSNGYRAEMWTGWLGDPRSELDFMEFVLRMDLPQRKIIQVRARYLGSSLEDSEDESGGAAGAPIGSFIIGVSAIAGQTVGAISGDLVGDSATHVQFGIIDEQDSVACRIHGLTAYYLRGSSWVAPAA